MSSAPLGLPLGGREARCTVALAAGAVVGVHSPPPARAGRAFQPPAAWPAGTDGTSPPQWVTPQRPAQANSHHWPSMNLPPPLLPPLQPAAEAAVASCGPGPGRSGRQGGTPRVQHHPRGAFDPNRSKTTRSISTMLVRSGPTLVCWLEQFELELPLGQISAAEICFPCSKLEG